MIVIDDCLGLRGGEASRGLAAVCAGAGWHTRRARAVHSLSRLLAVVLCAFGHDAGAGEADEVSQRQAAYIVAAAVVPLAWHCDSA